MALRWGCPGMPAPLQFTGSVKLESRRGLTGQGRAAGHGRAESLPPVSSLPLPSGPLRGGLCLECGASPLPAPPALCVPPFGGGRPRRRGPFPQLLSPPADQEARGWTSGPPPCEWCAEAQRREPWGVGRDRRALCVLNFGSVFKFPTGPPLPPTDSVPAYNVHIGDC